MERQLKHHKIPISDHTIQHNSHKYTKQAHMYKQRPVKQVSESNAVKRVEYGHRHKGLTVKDFWSFVAFTDEKHWDVGYTQQNRIF